MARTIDGDYQVIEAPRVIRAAPVDSAVPESQARGWWLAALALAVAWFIYVIPWLFQGYVIPWDAKDYYYPVLRFLAGSLAQGESGEWNPYLYSGFPAIADPQSWFFTPTFRLFAALDAAPSMTRMDAVELLHLLLGAIGLLMLCRALGLRPLAATIAGLVFMFGGVAASRLQHTLMIVSYAWLPWALLLLTLACDSARRDRRLIYAAAFGLVAGLMAVDRDQVALLNCLLLLGMAGWQVARRLWPQPRAALRTALELMPAAVTGLLVLAIPMLLTLDLLAMSTRPEIDYATAAHASLQPASLLTLLHPDIYGSLQPDGYWGPGRPALDGAFGDSATTGPTRRSAISISASCRWPCSASRSRSASRAIPIADSSSPPGSPACSMPSAPTRRCSVSSTIGCPASICSAAPMTPPSWSISDSPSWSDSPPMRC